MKDLLKRIKHHEGFRKSVYQCTEGYDTIGYGFAIKDLEMDEDIAEEILVKKIKNLVSRVETKFDWFKYSHESIREVVVEMCYQLGLSGFSKFKKTILYFANKDYKKASVEMLDSKWATQTPNRAKKLSKIVESVG